MKKLLLLSALILSALPQSLHAFEYDGLEYGIFDDRSCELIKVPTEYDGECSLPEQVPYNGTEYTLTHIGSEAFKNCRNLTSVTIPNTVVSFDGDGTFYYCSKLTSVSLPKYISTIPIYMFMGCSSLESITIPSYVTTIDGYAFCYCANLTSVEIPESVTSIGEGVFSSCESLTSVTLPNSISEIPNYMFDHCDSLRSITIPESVTWIGDQAFYSCKSLTNINIPEAVTHIGNNAFGYCRSLTNINIPDGVTSIGEFTFYCCNSLTNITLPESLTSIGNYVFGECYDLTNITLPDGITSIGDNTFYYCFNLTEITLPDGVTSIGNYAFMGCSSLTSINIPDAVTFIGKQAFSNCGRLSSITYKTNSPTSFATNIFDSSVYRQATLYVLEGATEAMRATTPWSSFENIVEIPPVLDINFDSALGYVLYDGKAIQSPYEIDLKGKTDTYISLTVIPKDGYRIDAMELNGDNVFTVKNPDNTYEINVNRDILTSVLDIRFAEIGVATLSVTAPGHHTVTHSCPEGSDITVTLEPQEGWNLHSVTLNDEPIELDNENKISIPAIFGHNNLNAIYVKNDVTDINTLEAGSGTPITITLSNNILSVSNKPADASVMVYDLSGNMVTSSTDDELYIPLSNDVAIIKVADKVFKVAIK